MQLAAQIRRGSSPGQAVPESLLPGDAKRAWTDMNAAHEHGTLRALGTSAHDGPALLPRACVVVLLWSHEI